jgi:copper chaperone CopZ
MESLSVVAPAIHCEGCAGSITRSLSKLHGVEAVRVDVETKRVDVDFDEAQTGEAAIRQRLELAGFPAEPPCA